MTGLLEYVRRERPDDCNCQVRSEIVISPDGRTVDVTALAGGGFAAGWAEQNQTITSLQALFLDSFGQVAGPEIFLASTISRASGPELGMLTGGGFVATWTLDNGFVSHAPHVGGRMVSAAGVAGPSSLRRKVSSPSR